MEDLLLAEGKPGLDSSIQILRDLANYLAGNKTAQDLKISIKYDSAPAILFGYNPENNKFFVGTKSVFNVREPKINYTDEDIDLNHTEVGLNKRLKIALKYLPELKPKFIYQAELMYIQDDLKEINIDDVDYTTFKTNLITYASMTDSVFTDQIKNSKCGVIVHTQYSGNTILDLVATNNIITDIKKDSENVWCETSDFEIKGDRIKFNATDKNDIHKYLKDLDNSSNDINSEFLKDTISNALMLKNINLYNNSLVRFGEEKTPDKKADELITYIRQSFDDSILSLKTDNGKNKKRDQASYFLKYLERNKDELIKIYTIQDVLVKLKLILLKHIQSDNIFETYVEENAGEYKKIDGEGVVIGYSEGFVKLVDRSEFSRLNFNLDKPWNRDLINNVDGGDDNEM